MGSALKEHSHLTERWPSTDDEFDDAITTVSDSIYRSTNNLDVSRPAAVLQRRLEVVFSYTKWAQRCQYCTRLTTRRQCHECHVLIHH